MSPKLPPLNALKVFATVFQAGSFTAASTRLHISQSAVTRQIAILEEYVGIKLFRRHGRGIEPTEAGEAYASKVCPAFDTIAMATAQLTRSTQAGPLTIQTYTTLYAKWLIPRLAAFMQAHPEVEVQVKTSPEQVDFARDNVDAAIQFGSENWGDLAADLLIRDEAEPVCSPSFLSQVANKPEGSLQALLSSRLLVSEQRGDDWDEWFRFSGLRPASTRVERMTFATYALTWQATIDGLGVSIGYIPQLRQDIEAGRLVTPFNLPMRRNKGYFLVRPKNFSPHPHLSIFRNWLLSATATLR
jgi:LysR family transcriptional regulator, glycine cleavage system transcriptional activator